MNLNSPEQIQTGRDLLRKYGSWDRIREHSRYDWRRGVWLINRSERAGSPIGQNDKPGLAFSDAGKLREPVKSA